jgi:hypothetical protein
MGSSTALQRSRTVAWRAKVAICFTRRHFNITGKQMPACMKTRTGMSGSGDITISLKDLPGKRKRRKLEGITGSNSELSETQKLKHKERKQLKMKRWKPDTHCGSKIREEQGSRVHVKQLSLNRRKETSSFENKGKKSTSQAWLLRGENEGT